jgi:putative redox protein
MADVSVHEDGPRYGQRIRLRHHELVADEPPEKGGGDRGPSPYDLLLAALGACTTMTVRMYADRKQWPLKSVSARLSHGKIDASECDDCETKEGKVDRIEVDLSLEGDLSDEQRARLMEIADRCPVHRTLLSEIRIVTRAR